MIMENKKRDSLGEDKVYWQRKSVKIEEMVICT